MLSFEKTFRFFWFSTSVVHFPKTGYIVAQRFLVMNGSAYQNLIKRLVAIKQTFFSAQYVSSALRFFGPVIVQPKNLDIKRSSVGSLQKFSFRIELCRINSYQKLNSVLAQTWKFDMLQMRVDCASLI